jgi:hypothetical protein
MITSISRLTMIMNPDISMAIAIKPIFMTPSTPPISIAVRRWRGSAVH